MTAAEFTNHFPYAFHMAHVKSWDMIRRHGLLSTSALLDLFQVTGARRKALESRHRAECVELTHRRHGKAVIRDQKPLREKALKKCLTDMTPPQWYRLLNGQVFFWVTEERVKRLLNARAYRSDAHCVIKLRLDALLQEHAEDVRLCPINSGATIYKPQTRGRKSFLPLGQYPFAFWKKRRGSIKTAVGELTVAYKVPDVSSLVISVEIWKQDTRLRRIL